MTPDTPPLDETTMPVQQPEDSSFTYQDIHGWFDFEDIYEEMVSKAASSPTPSTFVEIGAWMGKSTAYMGGLIKDVLDAGFTPITFYAVDTWKGTGDDPHFRELLSKHNGDIYNAFLGNMFACDVTDQVTPLRMTSAEAATQFPDGSIDFIFVDGAHDYGSVYSDITTWLPKLKAGGTIGGHDVGFPGVDRAVWEVLPDAKRYVGRTSGSTWVYHKPVPAAPAQETVTP